MNEEAKIVLKLHLCNHFIDNLSEEKLITEHQRRKLRNSVKRRIIRL